MGSTVLGAVLVVAGGLLGLAPLVAARAVNAVRLWPRPDRLSADVVRSCRVVGFLMAALGLVLLIPAVT
ncbi:MAG TPA: hypothetical protein VF743_02760 [Acidimicrobiales bacterium]